MKWISSIILIWALCLFQLTSAACECGNDQQSFTPSYFFIDPSSTLNDTDGSSSGFSSTCTLGAGLYQCTSNYDDLFDCNDSNNSFYGWDVREVENYISIVTYFTSHFHTINVSMTFLISTPSNVSAPTLLQYLLILNGTIVSSLMQDYLPTNLPEGTYQHDFKLSNNTVFNGIAIVVTPNDLFQWIAIGNVAFCDQSTRDVSTPLNDNDNDSVSIVILSVEAAVAALLLIIIALLIIILLLHVIKRRKMFNDVKAVAIKLSSRSGITRGDHNAAGTSQHSHKEKDTLSQGSGVKVDSSPSLEIIDDLYISTKTKSLDSLEQSNSKSITPSIVDRDLSITPNPSYAVPSQVRPKSKHEYDYIATNKSLHKEYLQLGRSFDSPVTACPAHDVHVTNGLNPSSLRPLQDSQDITQDDYMPYVQMHAAK